MDSAEYKTVVFEKIVKLYYQLRDLAFGREYNKTLKKIVEFLRRQVNQEMYTAPENELTFYNCFVNDYCHFVSSFESRDDQVFVKKTLGTLTLELSDLTREYVEGVQKSPE